MPGGGSHARSFTCHLGHTVEAYSESTESFFELIKVALDQDFPEEKRVFIDMR